MNEDIRHISLRVNPQLFKSIKVKCAEEGRTMNDYIIELVRKDLEASANKLI